MGGIGLILNAAKDALLTQQYAIDIISHNISNVNTEGYSRQIPVIEAKIPAPYGGFIFGRGVELEEILRQSDNFVETRLRQRKSDLAAMSEKEVYISVLEGIFNESSGRGLSTQFSDFWNVWHDLSNNPSGLPERNIIYETGSLMAQGFSDMYNDLSQFDQELNLSIDTGVEKINQLISQIATLNEQIFNLEITADANDLRDQRNTMLNQLSEYINISSFEDNEGHLTITTGTGGYTLVCKTDTYQLSLNGDNIEWESSGNAQVDITNRITGGKMGGWLDMRDEIIPKYMAELDELAKSFVWEVNKIHSQGVGLEGFSSLTGTYAATNILAGMGTAASGLDFHDGITDGSFKIWLYDDTGAVVDSTTLNIVANTTTLSGLTSSIDGVSIGGEDALNATVTDGKLYIEVDTGSGYTGYTFAFSEDTSNVLAALGINTFFNGRDALSMEMNSTLNSKKEFIAAGCLDSTTGEIAVGDNSNSLDILNLQYQDVTIKRWTYERGESAASQDVTDTFENYFHYLVSSVGIKSQGIKREKEYNEIIVNQLNEKRDSISAVSLDEEMTNLIKFQHAYAAAAKLIATADEMLKTLLELK